MLLAFALISRRFSSLFLPLPSLARAGFSQFPALLLVVNSCLSTVGLFFLINPFPVQSSRRFFKASVSSLERAFGF